MLLPSLQVLGRQDKRRRRGVGDGRRIRKRARRATPPLHFLLHVCRSPVNKDKEAPAAKRTHYSFSVYLSYPLFPPHYPLNRGGCSIRFASRKNFPYVEDREAGDFQVFFSSCAPPFSLLC